jgi:23S rRNA (uracil1939-C5)-methyltransferase
MNLTLTVDQIIEGEIETIAFGGEGILRYHGFVIFVPFTAIGDRISCRITEIKRSFAKGILVELKRASSYRTQPLCPYFGTCGGCQLQHLNEQAQLKYKLGAVKDALQRIGHLSLPPLDIIPASANWAYRRHITLHLKPKENGFEAGYIGQDNHSLVVVQTCPIFNEPHHPIIKELQYLIGNLTNPSQQEGRVTLLKNHRNQFILFFQFRHQIDINLKTFQIALQQSPDLAGIIVQTPDEQISLGYPYCEQKLEGLTCRFSPQTFSQNHPEQSANIYRHICQLAREASQHHILDLYCGFGILSLLLAQQGHPVTGIEYNAESIKFAQENAAFNHVKNAHFIQGDVEKILPRWLKTHQASLIIVNPPRHGLSKGVVQTLLKAQVDSLIYVSCMPATLARDLNILCQHYQLQEGCVYDMFPQTAHIETLMYLKIKKKYDRLPSI